MATTRDEIRGWLEQGKKQGATHVIVVCDTYDWEDYPINVMPDQDVHAVYKHYHGPNMQKVMEVYDLKLGIEVQLNEFRAHHF